MYNSFDKVKEELSKRRSDIKYFTKDFYNTYCNACTQTAIDYVNGVKGKGYEDVFETDFYNKNSGAYCEFWTVMFDLFNKDYLVTFYNKDGILIREEICQTPFEEVARTHMEKEVEKNGYSFGRVGRR